MAQRSRSAAFQHWRTVRRAAPARWSDRGAGGRRVRGARGPRALQRWRPRARQRAV